VALDTEDIAECIHIVCGDGQITAERSQQMSTESVRAAVMTRRSSSINGRQTTTTTMAT